MYFAKSLLTQVAFKFFKYFCKLCALGIYSSRAVRNHIANDLLKTLLDGLHRNLANANCPWLREAGNSNENNVCKTDSPYF